MLKAAITAFTFKNVVRKTLLCRVCTLLQDKEFKLLDLFPHGASQQP